MYEFHIIKKSETEVNEFDFDSGLEEFNKFLKEDSIEYIKQGYSQVYYLNVRDSNQIIGYFTLSNAHIKFRRDIISFGKKIAFIPCALIGKLAIDSDYQGKNFGSKLLKRGIKKCINISKKIGCRLVIVDARTKLRVIKFYKRLGFRFIDNRGGKKIERALNRNHKPSSPTIKMFFDLKTLTNKIK